MSTGRYTAQIEVVLFIIDQHNTVSLNEQIPVGQDSSHGCWNRGFHGLGTGGFNGTGEVGVEEGFNRFSSFSFSLSMVLKAPKNASTSLVSEDLDNRYPHHAWRLLPL